MLVFPESPEHPSLPESQVLICEQSMINAPGREASKTKPISEVKKDSTTWACTQCKWKNREQNKVCGGNNPTFGCNAPKPEKWNCACGFRNRESNQICGGNGKMGCKSPHPRGAQRTQYHAPPAQNRAIWSQPMQHQRRPIEFQKQPPWARPARYQNQREPAPYQSQRVLPAYLPLAHYEQGPPARYEQGPPARFQRGPPAWGGAPHAPREKQEGWKCECGFVNRERNDSCGGRGTLGCKQPKPAKWNCACGFTNKPSNTKCGGFGPLGCDRVQKRTNENAMQGNPAKKQMI